MKALEILSNGHSQEKDLSRKDLAEMFGVHLRDLRPLFVRKHFLAVMPRKNSIIISVRSVKILIGRDRVYVFNIQHSGIERFFLPLLYEKIRATREEEIRFEHLALEITLQHIYQKFQRRYEDIERTSEQLLDKLGEKKVHDQTFEQLLHLKKRLSTITTHLTGLEEELTEIVDDDEDLRDLYLGDKTPTDTDDVESILEDVIDQIEDVGHRAQELEENIDDAQEILTLKMNNIRNMVIKFDLFLTAIACFLSVLAVATGFYGMNIQNHLEDNQYAIWILAAVFAAFFLIGVAGLVLWMRRKNMI